jgi:hypothetical protein
MRYKMKCQKENSVVAIQFSFCICGLNSYQKCLKTKDGIIKLRIVRNVYGDMMVMKSTLVREGFVYKSFGESTELLGT